MRKIAWILVLALLFVIGPAAALAQGHSATRTFTASPTAGVTGYNMYRAPCTGTITTNVCSAAGTPVKLNSTPFTALTYTDSTVAAGALYDYYATAVCPTTCTTTESAPSNHFAVTIPKDVVLPPGNLAVTTVTRNLMPNGNTQIVAGWASLPGTATTYTLYGNGRVLATGVLRNSSGNYLATWNGALKVGTDVTFEVCTSAGECSSKLL